MRSLGKPIAESSGLCVPTAAYGVGTYKRVLGKLRDRYVLELGPELADVDRRLIVAFAIGLDALQDR